MYLTLPQVVDDLFSSLSKVFWTIPLSSAMLAAQKKKDSRDIAADAETKKDSKVSEPEKDVNVTRVTLSSPAAPLSAGTVNIEPPQTSTSLTSASIRSDRYTVHPVASATYAMRWVVQLT